MDRIKSYILRLISLADRGFFKYFRKIFILKEATPVTFKILKDLK